MVKPASGILESARNGLAFVLGADDGGDYRKDDEHEGKDNAIL